MELKDSGTRREFDSGAVRDVAEGKGRLDLCPLGIIGKHFNDDILIHTEEYIRTGNPDCLWQALESFIAKKYLGWNDTILDVDKQYEDGAKKYNDRNWEKGIPLHCYIDSGIRHYLKYKRGDNDEPHDRAFVWNILGALWTQENKPEMIDLPFKEVTQGGSMTDEQVEWCVTLDGKCIQCKFNGVCELCSLKRGSQKGD
jgi:hypothetical protein